jgi:hypothetical protein
MNQYWGALNWLSETSPGYIRQVFHYQRPDAKGKARLLLYHYLCVLLVLLRYPRRMNIEHKFSGLGSRSMTEAISSISKGLIGLAAYPVAWLSDWAMDQLTIREWSRLRHSPNGSEMAVLFQRK